MLARAIALFHHYAREHLCLGSDGFALLDDGGRPFGAVERIRLARNRITVEGWADAQRVTLATPAERLTVTPNRKRSGAMPDGIVLRTATPGFWLELPYVPGRLELDFALDPPAPGLGADAAPDARPGTGLRHYVVDPFPAERRRRAAARLVPGYLLALARSVPAYLAWRATRDPAARARIKRLLGFDRTPAARPMDPALLPAGPVAPAAAAAAVDAATGATPVTIILPVHNARAVLTEALDRLARHTDLPWHLILIEDASTDPAVRPLLRDWAARQPAGQVELIENDRNLGFIRSVNLGIARALDRGDHVILLNSDALVPAGWASRLLRPILAAPESTATVTPASNDAEILSVPVIAVRSALAPGEADRIDAVAAGFDPQAAQVEVPTGIGFCMAMNILHLRQLDSFDPGFGRGYGEEVDWCQRIRAAGGRHVGLAGLFVEHRGGASFGATEKLRLVTKNNAIISARYPGYDAEVQEFLRADPLITARLALAIAWAAARGGDRPVPLYLAHALGGGAEDYLVARLAADLDPRRGGGAAALVLRVGTDHRWRLEAHTPLGVTMGATADFELIRRLLAPLPHLRVVYSCGVDDPDAIELPDRLLSLLRGPQDRAEALVHDFLPISPSYTLLDSDGFHRGLPAADTTDRAHLARRPDGTLAPLGDWQAAWERFLSACDRIVTFSPNSRDLIARAYPRLGGRIVVEPHGMLVEVPRCPPPPRGRRPVIGVLGNIGQQKGAAVLAELSRRFARTGAADLVLIGTIDPNFALAAKTRVHGSYARRDIPDLVARYGIDCWLIPSIWPETFSYTTHECIATGLPVWSFDLGAQGDAVRAAAARTGLGGVLPLSAGRPPIDLLIAHLLGEIPRPGPAGPAARRRQPA